EVESDCACIRFEQFARIRGLAPGVLFPIEHVVHLPKTALQPGCFSSQRRLTSVLVHRERKIPKDYAQTRIVLVLELARKCREHTARRALEIAVLFKCYGCVRVPTNVRCPCIAFCGDCFVLRNGSNVRSSCSVKHCTASDGGQCD